MEKSKEQNGELKMENENPSINFQPQTPPLPEADRLLTEQKFFINQNCTIDINNPNQKSLWDIYAPNGKIDPNTKTHNCPFSPAFVTREKEIRIQGLAEKNQRITLSKTRIKRDQNNQNKIIADQTQYLEFAVNEHTTQCYNYQDHPELFPELDYKKDQEGNKTTTGEPIPGIHLDLISRGNLITKFHEICKWEYNTTLDDQAQSPYGEPQNWYRFSYHIKDLAGNTPVETSNDEIENQSKEQKAESEEQKQKAESKEQKEENLKQKGKTIESKSITLYTDREVPKDHRITNIKDKNHNPVLAYPNNPNSNLKTGAITRETKITLNQFGERAADIEYQLNRKTNTKNQTTGSHNYNPEEKQTLNQNPDNIIDKYTKLQQNGYNGQSSTTLPLGQEKRDDQDEQNCTTISNHPIKNRRVGICNDGIYTARMRMTDTAGSTGSWTSQSLERDTTSPTAPNLQVGKTGDIFQEYLTLSITGEAYTRAKINIKNQHTFNQDYHINLNTNGTYTSNKFISLPCGEIEYTITVTLTDRAGNTSSSTTRTIKTEECANCTIAGNGLFAFPLGENQTKARFTSDYPIRKTATNFYAPHAGLDFGVAAGTPIYASYDGIVKRAVHYYPEKPDFSLNWGNVVILVHNINGVKYQTIYAHLNRQKVLEVGQTVKKGQLIGYVGESGASTGPHLHYQVEREGAPLHPALNTGVIRWNMQHPVDPKIYLGEIEGNIPEEDQDWFCDNDNYGGDYEYKEIDKDKAEQILANYIDQNLGTKTTLTKLKNNQPPRTLQEILDNKENNQSNTQIIKQTIEIQKTQCGIYYYPLDRFYNKNNNHSGHTGAIYVSPYREKAYIIKNGIHEKYLRENGTCGPIGIPNTEERTSNIPPNSIANTAYWQGFERGGAIQKQPNLLVQIQLALQNRQLRNKLPKTKHRKQLFCNKSSC